MHELALPVGYYASFMVSIIGIAIGLINLQKAWAPGFLAVIGTFFFWYLVEPIYTPENMVHFQPDHIETAYLSAVLFIMSFVILFFMLQGSSSLRTASRPRSMLSAFYGPGSVSPERLAVFAMALWLVLLAIGTWRLNGDLMDALFPTNMRNGAGASMWQRYAGARAGPSGFLVSTASYLYILVLSSFGILLPLVRSRRVRLMLVIVILIAWPYAFLAGARSIVTAIVAPFIVSFLLFSRVSIAIKIGIIAVILLILEFSMRFIISARGTGFDLSVVDSIGDQRHLGLNMASELVWITSFLDSGRMQPSWGGRYFAEAVNFVPRAFWSDKPLIGIDYALMRGSGDASTDIGVHMTISTGMIGQGVVNFGLFLGPIVAALLMAVWANFLCRLRLQATAPRLGLFLLGLGLTFNLGRDITLLVLFPFLFGYLAVRILESASVTNSPNATSRRNVRSKDA